MLDGSPRIGCSNDAGVVEDGAGPAPAGSRVVDVLPNPMPGDSRVQWTVFGDGVDACSSVSERDD